MCTLEQGKRWFKLKGGKVYTRKFNKERWKNNLIDCIIVLSAVLLVGKACEAQAQQENTHLSEIPNRRGIRVKVPTDFFKKLPPKINCSDKPSETLRLVAFYL